MGNDLQRSKYKGTSGRDGNAHYLNCGGGLMNVDSCQTSTCTLKMGVILLYVNSTSIKLIYKMKPSEF